MGNAIVVVIIAVKASRDDGARGRGSRGVCFGAEVVLYQFVFREGGQTALLLGFGLGEGDVEHFF